MRKMGLKEALAKLIYSDQIFKQAIFCRGPSEIKKSYRLYLALSISIPVFELRIKKGDSFRQEFQFLLNQYLN